MTAINYETYCGEYVVCVLGKTFKFRKVWTAVPGTMEVLDKCWT